MIVVSITRKILIILACILSSCITAQAEYPEIKSSLKDQVGDICLDDTILQVYRLTTDWHNRDLYGNSVAHFFLSGKYTRGLGEGRVRWNDVMIEMFSSTGQTASDTISQGWMEDFTYQSPYDIARPDFFELFPMDESVHLLRTLIWDAVAFEVFAWSYFDKLELNIPFIPSDLDDFDVPMADWGTFKMKNLKLAWTGLSQRNGETCALIQYESYANPVESGSSLMSVKGRSLYWGSIHVSLDDMQIEYATMNEDIIMEVKNSTLPEKKRLNIQREVKFEKIN